MADKTLDIYSTDYIDDLVARFDEVDAELKVDMQTLTNSVNQLVINSGGRDLGINLVSTISKNGIITLVKGDTFRVKLDMNIGNPIQPYYFQLQEGDYVTLKVMYANNSWNDAILTKVATIDNLDNLGNVIIEFTSDDTNYINCGMYIYQVKLYYSRNGKDYVNTLVPRTRLFITE